MKNTTLQDSAKGLIVVQKIMPLIYSKEFDEAINEPYKISYIPKKNTSKKRKIEAPPEKLKEICKEVTNILQTEFERPPYCMCGWKGTNCVQNALIHTGNKFFITADICQCFPNSKEKYVREFFESIGFQDDSLNRIVKLTTYEEHLPTGAPTSPILTALIHKSLFDVIYKKMKEQGITFTTYIDDMTFSSNKHIPNGVIKYVNKVLNTHGLHLKSSKIKRFGYKGAIITGIKTTQSGRLEIPYSQGLDVIGMLKKMDITQMDEYHLKQLIGKIYYVQQITPNGKIAKLLRETAENNAGQPTIKKAEIELIKNAYFQTTKVKAKKRLKKITNNNKKGV